jgi:hypothetical protein
MLSFVNVGTVIWIFDPDCKAPDCAGAAVTCPTAQPARNNPIAITSNDQPQGIFELLTGRVFLVGG